MRWEKFKGLTQEDKEHYRFMCDNPRVHTNIGGVIHFIILVKIYLMLLTLTVFLLRNEGYLEELNASIFYANALQVVAVMGVVFVGMLFGDLVNIIIVWYKERKLLKKYEEEGDDE